jgi:peptide/nickel transport system ATP-binding protein
MTGLAIMRLLPKLAQVIGGQVMFSGTDLLQRDDEKMEEIRGRQISMIFQNAATSLNPVFTIGQQIADVYCRHTRAGNREGMAKAVEVLNAMGMPDAVQRARAYPHELSGGMSQRALVAMALVSSPRLLIADEVTSGLDVTIQTQVLELIGDVAAETGAALLLISHDIGVVAEVCADVAVMYSGQVVEASATRAVLERPFHPYTRGLLSSFAGTSGARMGYIPGTVSDLRVKKPECPFAPRCSLAEDRCRMEIPLLREIEPGHDVACHVV